MRNTCNINFHFNPLPPHGGRPLHLTGYLAMIGFQSTPSAWRETIVISPPRCAACHFNPLPPHGGRHDYILKEPLSENISIHSLRMEGDVFQAVDVAADTGISIHSLRMEGDSTPFVKSTNALAISIHSLRMEGDFSSNVISSNPEYFNPLPPHGGRRDTRYAHYGERGISIHSLRMEGDFP